MVNIIWSLNLLVSGPIILLWAAYLLCASLYKRLRKFNYNLAYLKIKPGDKIKITFIDQSKKICTIKGKVVSVSNQSISLKNKDKVYEYDSSEIINIKKRSYGLRFLILYFIITLLLALSARDVCYAAVFDENGNTISGGCRLELRPYFWRSI